MRRSLPTWPPWFLLWGRRTRPRAGRTRTVRGRRRYRNSSSWRRRPQPLRYTSTVLTRERCSDPVCGPPRLRSGLSVQGSSPREVQLIMLTDNSAGTAQVAAVRRAAEQVNRTFRLTVLSVRDMWMSCLWRSLLRSRSGSSPRWRLVRSRSPWAGMICVCCRCRWKAFVAPSW